MHDIISDSASVWRIFSPIKRFWTFFLLLIHSSTSLYLAATGQCSSCGCHASCLLIASKFFLKSELRKQRSLGQREPFSELRFVKKPQIWGEGNLIFKLLYRHLFLLNFIFHQSVFFLVLHFLSMYYHYSRGWMCVASHGSSNLQIKPLFPSCSQFLSPFFPPSFILFGGSLTQQTPPTTIAYSYSLPPRWIVHLVF